MTFYLVVKLLSLDSDNTSEYDVIKRMFMPFTCNHMIVFMSHHFKNVVLIVPKVIIQAVTNGRSVTSEPVCTGWGKYGTFMQVSNGVP